MFYQLRISIINNEKRLFFNWQKEEERLVIRNKLTKNEYFNRPCTDLMRKN